jgi:hypothetical protein
LLGPRDGPAPCRGAAHDLRGAALRTFHGVIASARAAKQSSTHDGDCFVGRRRLLAMTVARSLFRAGFREPWDGRNGGIGSSLAVGAAAPAYRPEAGMSLLAGAAQAAYSPCGGTPGGPAGKNGQAHTAPRALDRRARVCPRCSPGSGARAEPSGLPGEHRWPPGAQAAKPGGGHARGAKNAKVDGRALPKAPWRRSRFPAVWVGTSAPYQARPAARGT